MPVTTQSKTPVSPLGYLASVLDKWLSGVIRKREIVTRSFPVKAAQEIRPFFDAFFAYSNRERVTLANPSRSLADHNVAVKILESTEGFQSARCRPESVLEAFTVLLARPEKDRRLTAVDLRNVSLLRGFLLKIQEGGPLS